MKKQYFEVNDKIWTSDTAAVKTLKGWEPATPERYVPSLLEWLQHKVIGHYSFGQPYCVQCGLTARRYTRGICSILTKPSEEGMK